MTAITANMSAEEMANIIFDEFEVLQSCKIEGFEFKGRHVKPKGELVCDFLWELDRTKNCYVKEKKAIRKQKRPPNSIGGYAAQKIFKWEYFINDDYVKYTIWRIQ